MNVRVQSPLADVGFNPNDPFEDTERGIDPTGGTNPYAVSTPTIRSRILKARRKRAVRTARFCFNPNDPFEDTES